MKNLVLATALLLTAGAGFAHASVNVPDGGTTLGLLTGALVGLGVLKTFRR